ncbi:MAG: hypothetical protein U0528_09210 [Anaerolineae bacterium]
MATVYAHVKPGWDKQRIQQAFEAAYADEPLVTLTATGQAAQMKQAVHKNFTPSSRSPRWSATP